MGQAVQLQGLSSGIHYEGYQNGYRVCTWGEDGVGPRNRDETYTWRCPEEKQCCANRCCIPAAAGIPLWLLILILILVGLLLACLLIGIIYYCLKFCKRDSYSKHKIVTSRAGGGIHNDSDRSGIVIGTDSKGTIVNGYGRDGTKNGTAGSRGGRRIEISGNGHRNRRRDGVDFDSNDDDLERANPRTFHDLDTPDSTMYGQNGTEQLHGTGERRHWRSNNLHKISLQHRNPYYESSSEPRSSIASTILSQQQQQQRKPFIPDKMEETYLPAPKPIPIGTHDEKEFTKEQRPLISINETPEEQSAKFMYYRPFVPSHMEETIIPAPERGSSTLHHTDEWAQAKRPVVQKVSTDEKRQAETLYMRPGQDKVAAY